MAIKVSLCCICKNEKNRIRTWWETAKQADHIVVIDTGSDDGSLELLSELSDQHPSFGIAQYVGDFRFDYARQAALDLALPNSVCMWLDMDETFDYGWADELRDLPTSPTQVRTRMNTGSVSYFQTKGSQKKAKWKYRVHEVLDVADTVVYESEFQTYHNQEQGKEYRGQYLHLLEADYDDPATRDLRTSFYLLREYCYTNNRKYVTKVKTILQLMLTMRGWDQFLLFARFHAASYLSDKDPIWENLVYQISQHPSTEAKYEAANAAYLAANHFLSLHLAFSALNAVTETNLMFEYADKAIAASKRLIVDNCVALGFLDKALYYGSCFNFDISDLVGKIKPTETESACS